MTILYSFLLKNPTILRVLMKLVDLLRIMILILILHRFLAYPLNSLLGNEWYFVQIRNLIIILVTLGLISEISDLFVNFTYHLCYNPKYNPKYASLPSTEHNWLFYLKSLMSIGLFITLYYNLDLTTQLFYNYTIISLILIIAYVLIMFIFDSSFVNFILYNRYKLVISKTLPLFFTELNNSRIITVFSFVGWCSTLLSGLQTNLLFVYNYQLLNNDFVKIAHFISLTLFVYFIAVALLSLIYKWYVFIYDAPTVVSTNIGHSSNK